MVRYWLFLLPPITFAQVTTSDCDRALKTRTRYENLVIGTPGPATWIGDTGQFWYRVSAEGGNGFVVVDAKTSRKEPAFDHEKLAAALSRVPGGQTYTAVTLPFATFRYEEGRRVIRFDAAGSSWLCDVESYVCRQAPSAAPGQNRPVRPPEDEAFENPAEPENDVIEGVEYSGFEYVVPQQGAGRGAQPLPADQLKTSPDGKWDALIRNYNVFVREHGKKDSSAPGFLSLDGSEGNYYTYRSITWSPDSTHLVAYRVRPGYRREVHYVESSPTDQLQPKHSTRDYAKPGDALDIASPVLFDVAAKRQFNIDNALFPNAFSITQPAWRKSSKAFTFEYNQRGHQLYRVLEVHAATGSPRAVITEESKTFIDYRPLVQNQRDTGKKVRYDIDDGREVIWMSERDGWAHLYLYDGLTGRVKNQITKGEWVVRSVDHIDEKARQIWFSASGMYAAQDPYFVYYYASASMARASPASPKPKAVTASSSHPT